MSMSFVPCLKKVTCSNVLFFTFCIYMQFSKLTEAEVWLDASTQIFFSLGLAFGGLISMASYNPINNNIVRDALLVSIVNCGTSIFAGITIFGILGYKVRMVHILGFSRKKLYPLPSPLFWGYLDFTMTPLWNIWKFPIFLHWPSGIPRFFLKFWQTTLELDLFHCCS